MKTAKDILFFMKTDATHMLEHAKEDVGACWGTYSAATLITISEPLREMVVDLAWRAYARASRAVEEREADLNRICKELADLESP